MLKAVFLDLDNTLVLFDETAFYMRYMERIIPFFEDIVPAEQFRDRLLRGIRGLLRNDGTLRNHTYFLNSFCAGYDDQQQIVWDRFLHFYETEYDHIPVQAQKPAGLTEMLAQLEAWGLQLVVATNPLFPLIAQVKRLNWAGLALERFSMLTHLENTSFVKPRMEYYRQICETLGLAPETCLMVGNDAVNDMVAGAVGLKTFMTTEAGQIDYGAVSKGRNIRPGKCYPADFSGPLSQVAAVVDQLRR